MNDWTDDFLLDELSYSSLGDAVRRFYLLEDPNGVFGALDDSLLQHTDVRSRDS